MLAALDKVVKTGAGNKTFEIWYSLDSGEFVNNRLDCCIMRELWPFAFNLYTLMQKLSPLKHDQNWRWLGIAYEKYQTSFVSHFPINKDPNFTCCGSFILENDWNLPCPSWWDPLEISHCLDALLWRFKKIIWKADWPNRPWCWLRMHE